MAPCGTPTAPTDLPAVPGGTLAEPGCALHVLRSVLAGGSPLGLGGALTESSLLVAVSHSATLAVCRSSALLFESLNSCCHWSHSDSLQSVRLTTRSPSSLAWAAGIQFFHEASYSSVLSIDSLR
ncbi:hypothetical protein KUCAC02_025443 [Chaenocephalus aceratus]|uniref:Uncharacterized protein n=1 Tax=Chaenocephalus aceratus TaxID=36190 RepID=A0ACB9VU86_CHAAC|nr:hypothetical protein KUCAC02_025443 [Chaenocephalus aceratus]